MTIDEAIKREKETIEEFYNEIKKRQNGGYMKTASYRIES